jgi:hypothetical protein
MEDESFLDCCDNPKLQFVKTIHEASHDDESLHQCQNCRGYWFYRFSEYVSFHGDDDITVWYSPITADEARMIIESEVRPDLSFLTNRASFMIDDNVVKRTAGQPDRPRYY